MKIRFFAAALLCLIPTIVQAGYVGVPLPLEREQHFPIRVVMDLSNREINDFTGTRTYTFSNYAIHGEARVTPHLNLIGRLGYSEVSTEDDRIQMDGSIFWGLGAKASLFYLDNYNLGFGCGVNFRNLDNKSEDDNIRLFYKETDFFLGGVYSQFKTVQPYGGILSSSISGELKYSETDRRHLEEKNDIGVFGGAEVYISPQLDLCGELRVASETAFTFFLNYYMYH